jgi:hypothetical protein
MACIVQPHLGWTNPILVRSQQKRKDSLQKTSHSLCLNLSVLAPVGLKPSDWKGEGNPPNHRL